LNVISFELLTELLSCLATLVVFVHDEPFYKEGK